MNHKTFTMLVKNRLDFCQKILSSKDKEYSSDTDRLHNFVVAGRVLGCTPIKALNGMKVKHSVSVGDIFDKMEADPLYCPSKQLVDDKITDVINYLLLAEGLIEDRRATVAIEPIFMGNNAPECEEFDPDPHYFTVECQKCGTSMTDTAKHFENLNLCPGCIDDQDSDKVPPELNYCTECHYSHGFHSVTCSHKVKGPTGQKA